jgi:hypothetical protein
MYAHDIYHDQYNRSKQILINMVLYYYFRSKIKVMFGHKLRYKTKVMFGEISLKLRPTNQNVAKNK